LKELRVLSPTGILGYGFPKESFQQGLELEPDMIGVDAGSTDAGPYYLGAGVSFTDRNAVKRDLQLLLNAAVEKGIPLLIGSAGGAGADPHLQWCVNIVKEIAKEEGLNFKMATISADITKKWIKEKIKKKEVVPLKPVPEIKEEDVEQAIRIVAQMGVEPFIAALEKGAQVIVAGRANDPDVFAALAIKEGFNPGLALHMGKILECAAIAAEPGSGRDCMFGIIRDDHFEVEPLNPERRCTATSVAAHTLYEKDNPYELYGPGRIVDLRNCTFEEVNSRRVRVFGTKFKSSNDYYVKLEGVKKVGFRTICIAGVKDPIMIKQIDEILKEIKKSINENFDNISKSEYTTIFRIYGRDGVMGKLEPEPLIKSHEIGIVIDVVAKTQELANTICSFARSTLLHYGYPGRIATAGNLAFPYSPSDIKVGEVYEFNIYHLARLEDPTEVFPIQLEEVKGGEIR